MPTPRSHSRSASPVLKEDSAAAASIEVTAKGSRRALEALYLELRELAKQNGLEVEYRLSTNKPEDCTDS